MHYYVTKASLSLNAESHIAPVCLYLESKVSAEQSYYRHYAMTMGLSILLTFDTRDLTLI